MAWRHKGSYRKCKIRASALDWHMVMKGPTCHVPMLYLLSTPVKSVKARQTGNGRPPATACPSACLRHDLLKD